MDLSDKAINPVDEIMEQAQVFASAWSLVGGRFDNGNMLTEAEEAKAELRKAIEALAQPAGEAEPVYQYQLANGNWIDQIKDSYEYNLRHGQANVRVLYTTPQQSQPLTDEQARKIIEDNDWYNFPEEVIRATEAAHGIKKGGTE